MVALGLAKNLMVFWWSDAVERNSFRENMGCGRTTKQLHHWAQTSEMVEKQTPVYNVIGWKIVDPFSLTQT